MGTPSFFNLGALCGAALLWQHFKKKFLAADLASGQISVALERKMRRSNRSTSQLVCKETCRCATQPGSAKAMRLVMEFCSHPPMAPAEQRRQLCTTISCARHWSRTSRSSSTATTTRMTSSTSVPSARTKCSTGHSAYTGATGMSSCELFSRHQRAQHR